MENLHRIALVSANNSKDVIGTVEVWAKDMKAALKRIRQDPDMEGVRCFPAESLPVQEMVA